MDKMSPTLELATYEEIIAELKSRFANVLIVTTAASGTVGDKTLGLDLRAHGGHLTTLGMARYAEVSLMKILVEQSYEDDEDDEDEDKGGT